MLAKKRSRGQIIHTCDRLESCTDERPKRRCRLHVRECSNRLICEPAFCRKNCTGASRARVPCGVVSVKAMGATKKDGRNALGVFHKVDDVLLQLEDPDAIARIVECFEQFRVRG